MTPEEKRERSRERAHRWYQANKDDPAVMAERSRRARQWNVNNPGRVQVIKTTYRVRNRPRLNKERNERNRKVIAEKRAWLNAYKLKAGCADCGYNTHPVALDFDHVHPGKVANISRLMRDNRGWWDLLDEVAKCEVVCSNCHRIRTYERGQHYAPTEQAASPGQTEVTLF